MAEVAELAIETADAEMELTETEEERGIIPKSPERPESAGGPETEVVAAASEARAAERSAAEGKSPFAPPEEAIEAADEMRSEHNAEGTPEIVEEATRAETSQEKAGAGHAENESIEQMPEGEQNFENSPEPSGEKAVEHREEPSEVEQNGEAQEQTGTSRSEIRAADQIHHPKIPKKILHKK